MPFSPLKSSRGVLSTASAGGGLLYLSTVLGGTAPLVPPINGGFMTQIQPIAGAATFALTPLALGLILHLSPTPDAGCDTDNGGLVLPPGACATVVASGIG